MKAKVVEAFDRKNPEKDCYMVAIQEGKKGTRYNKYLAQDGKPYYTYHKDEAEDVALKLNIEFEQSLNLC